MRRHIDFYVIFVVGVVVVGLFALLVMALSTSASSVYGKVAIPAQPSNLGEASELMASTSLTPVAYLPFVANNLKPAAPLWRFGAAQGQQSLSLTEYMPFGLRDLRLGWYVDWWVTLDAPTPYGVEYVPTVRLKQWKLDENGDWTAKSCVGCSYVTPYTYTVSPGRTRIQEVAQANPGMLWLLGNEIDRIDWPGARQDEIVPELYAEAYHELYYLIKVVDPSAEVAIGGVVQATPLRLQYLTRVWDAYQSKFGASMPVDVWNIHAFVLREERGDWGADIPAGITNVDEGMLYSVADNKDFSIAWEHIRAMRQWMKDREQQNKPLIITEYGVNMPPHYTGFSYEEVRDSFLYPSFDHFLNQTDCGIGLPSDDCRLVQRWNWYSLDDDKGKYMGSEYLQNFNGNLFYSGLGDEAIGLSPLGDYWIQYVDLLSGDAVKPY